MPSLLNRTGIPQGHCVLSAVRAYVYILVLLPSEMRLFKMQVK